MKFRIHLAIVLVLLSDFASHSAFSQDAAAKEKIEKEAKSTTASAPSESEAELDAIRTQSQVFVAAFNKRDAKAVAGCWTEDGEFIDDNGRRWAGREEIEKRYTDIFAANPSGEIQIAIESLRLVSKGAAIEDGSSIVVPAPAGAGVSKYTAFHVKVGEQWLMASVRDLWIESSPAVRSAADLAWLVGTWIAEEHGVQTESVCRWGVDDRFLERKYTTTQIDGSKTSGVQLIGWNPLGEHVQSWDFSPDGGHAVGIWIPTDDGWKADVQGTTGAGIPTSAVNLLKRLDGDAYVWQSVQRTLGQASLPDTAEIVIKRNQQKTAK